MKGVELEKFDRSTDPSTKTTEGGTEWVGSASDAEKPTKTATVSANTNQSNTQTSTKRKPKQEKASKATAKTF